MRKSILKTTSLALILILLGLNVQAYPIYKDNISLEYVQSKQSAKVEFTMPVFEDDSASVLSKDLKKPQYRPRLFVDKAFVNADVKNSSKKEYVPVVFKDTPLRFTEENKYFIKPVTDGHIDVDSHIKVKISPIAIVKPVTRLSFNVVDGRKYAVYTEDPLIGTRVAFKINEDVYKDGELFIKKDTNVYAMVGRSVPSMMGGTAGEIQVERFRTFDVDGNMVRLSGVIDSEGFSSGYLTSLIGYCLTPLTFGATALLPLLVPGTSGVIKPNKEYIIYYIPN